ncbi:MAG: hypothetical protein ACHQ52_15070 [Candidatus Eisenbacteria bacterium]
MPRDTIWWTPVPMRMPPRLLPILLLAMTLPSCSMGTRFEGVWRDPTAPGPTPHKVLVVALTKERDQQKIYEQGMDLALAKRGVEVVNGSELFGGTLPDSETARAQVRAAGIDLAIVGRLEGVQQKDQYVPGNTYYTPAYATEGFYSWTYSSWAVMQDPGNMEHVTIVRIENRVFDVRTSRLVWSAMTHTQEIGGANELMGSVSGAVVGDLVKSKLLP